MQTAVNWDCLLAAIANKARSKTRQPTFIMIYWAWRKAAWPLQQSSWSSLHVRLSISMHSNIQVLHLVVDIHALLIHIRIRWGSIPRYACPQTWWQMVKLLILLQLVEVCLLLSHLWWQTKHSWVTCISAPSSASVVSPINWIQAHDFVMVWIVCGHLLLESGCVKLLELGYTAAHVLLLHLWCLLLTCRYLRSLWLILLLLKHEQLRRREMSGLRQHWRNAWRILCSAWVNSLCTRHRLIDQRRAWLDASSHILLHEHLILQLCLLSGILGKTWSCLNLLNWHWIFWSKTRKVWGSECLIDIQLIATWASIPGHCRV